MDGQLAALHVIDRKEIHIYGFWKEEQKKCSQLRRIGVLYLMERQQKR